MELVTINGNAYAFRLTIGACEKVRAATGVDLLACDPNPFYLMDLDEQVTIKVMAAVYYLSQTDANGDADGLASCEKSFRDRIADMDGGQYGELRKSFMAEYENFFRATSPKKSEVAQKLRETMHAAIQKIVESGIGTT